MSLRNTWVPLAAALSLWVACVKQVPPGVRGGAGAARPLKLVDETPERETPEFPGRRQDVRIETESHDPVPHVVAQGETPLVALEGGRARLYGDAEASKGFAVDNFLLLEVLNSGGTVLNRAAVGFTTEGVLFGTERIDTVGRLSFTFEPGEVDITALLPDAEPFRVRATALDYSGVGRVSSVYLVLEPRRAGSEDDLREQ